MFAYESYLQTVSRSFPGGHGEVQIISTDNFLLFLFYEAVLYTEIGSSTCIFSFLCPHDTCSTKTLGLKSQRSYCSQPHTVLTFNKTFIFLEAFL